MDSNAAWPPGYFAQDQRDQQQTENSRRDTLFHDFNASSDSFAQTPTPRLFRQYLTSADLEWQQDPTIRGEASNRRQPFGEAPDPMKSRPFHLHSTTPSNDVDMLPSSNHAPLPRFSKDGDFDNNSFMQEVVGWDLTPQHSFEEPQAQSPLQPPFHLGPAHTYDEEGFLPAQKGPSTLPYAPHHDCSFRMPTAQPPTINSFDRTEPQHPSYGPTRATPPSAYGSTGACRSQLQQTYPQPATTSWIAPTSCAGAIASTHYERPIRMSSQPSATSTNNFGQAFRSAYQPATSAEQPATISTANDQPVEPKRNRDEATPKKSKARRQPPAARSGHRMKKPTGRRGRATDQQVSAVSPDDYETDSELDDGPKSRKFLEEMDSQSLQLLDIEDDDWIDVKQNQARSFVSKIYHAFLEAPDMEPLNGPTLTAAKAEGFKRQQKDVLVALSDHLTPADRKKVAKARAWVLFDAAVDVHEKGVPSEVLEKAVSAYENQRQAGPPEDPNNQDGPKAPNAPKELNYLLKCSERMEQIVTAIQSNKMVAVSTYNGENFSQLVRNPQSYLRGKADYFKSNFKRPKANASNAVSDTRPAQEAAAAPTTNTQVRPKRKLVMSVEELDYSEDLDQADAGEEQDDDEYKPPIKVKSTKKRRG